MTETPLRSTTTAPLSLHRRPALLQDIPQMTHILITNLTNFEFLDHFSPIRHQHPHQFHAFILQRVRKFFSQPRVRFIVAAHPSTDQILGFATWEAVGRNNPIWPADDGTWAGYVEQRLRAVEGLYHRYFINTIFDYTNFERTWDRLHAASAGIESHFHLQWLMVDPAWQKGFGVGRALIEWGLEKADRVGLPVVLESSLAGYRFYLGRGFGVLGWVRIDVLPERAYDMPVMVYEPKGREGMVLKTEGV